MPVDQIETNEDTEISMADAIGAAYDAVEAGEPAPASVAIEIDEAPEVDPVDPEGVTQTEVETPETPVNTEVDGGDQSDEEGQEEQDPAPEDRAPSSWKREVADKWADLPVEARVEIQRRESDYHKGIEQYKQYAGIGQDIERVVAPYMQTLQSAGAHPMEAIDKLFKADQQLRYGSPDQKAQFLSKLAQDYGVDLEKVKPLPPVDPAVQALQMQNQQLQRFQQSIMTQQNQAVMSEIEQFKNDPANAHFDAVKEDMQILLQSNRAESLKDAYEKAVWMRPDIRKSLVEQQRTEAGNKAAQNARSQRAKSAAVGVKGSAPSKVSNLGPNASIEDTIGAAMDGLIS